MRPSLMSEFVAFLHEVFAEFGPIASKRMFGGHGIYHQGLMFALVADDTLYLKTDDGNRADFEAQDLPAFTYAKHGKPVKLSFTQAPEEIFDDPQLAREWAQSAFAAARRNAAKKR